MRSFLFHTSEFVRKSVARCADMGSSRIRLSTGRLDIAPHHQLPDFRAECLHRHQTEKKLNESGGMLLRQRRVGGYTPPIGDALCV